jgi:hypothetical protein
MQDKAQTQPIACFVVSWRGVNDKAALIEASLARAGQAVTVVGSGEDSREGWVRLPDSAFFGAKFAEILARAGDAVALIVTADAHCRDWPGLVAACAECGRQRWIFPAGPRPSSAWPACREARCG